MHKVCFMIGLYLFVLLTLDKPKAQVALKETIVWLYNLFKKKKSIYVKSKCFFICYDWIFIMIYIFLFTQYVLLFF